MQAIKALTQSRCLAAPSTASRFLSTATPHSRQAHLASSPAASTTDSQAARALKDDRSTELKEEKVLEERKITPAERDAEYLRKLEDISGEGGASGVEFEDGLPTSVKRSVRGNFFRYI